MRKYLNYYYIDKGGVSIPGYHEREMCWCQKANHLCNRSVLFDKIHELFFALLSVKTNIVLSTSTSHTMEIMEKKVKLRDSLCSNTLIHRLTCMYQGFNTSNINQLGLKKTG